jgi:hypothetical protein
VVNGVFRGETERAVSALEGRRYARQGPDNDFKLSARCIDGIDVHTLTVERCDGLHDMPGGDAPPLADPGAD